MKTIFNFAKTIFILSIATGCQGKSFRAANLGSSLNPGSTERVSVSSELSSCKSRFGLNTVLDTTENAARFNPGSVRIAGYWHLLENRLGVWDYSYVDPDIAQARANNQEILYILGFGHKNYPPYDYYALPTDMSHWDRYVTNVVSRYKDSVDNWEVWNEPDIPMFGALDPGVYVNLMIRTARIIRTIDPGAKVVMGGLANAAYGDPSYLRIMYQYGVKDYLDVVNYHHYTSETSVLAAGAQSIRNVMNEFGDGDKPIWITEAGVPGSVEAGNLQWQADVLQNMYTFLQNQTSIDRIFWFLSRDPPCPPGEDACGLAVGYGLSFLDSTIKPAGYVFASMAAACGGGELPPTPPPTIAPTAPPTPIPETGDNFVFCASENEFCPFSGSKEVRYGADGVYTYRVVNDGINCSNDVFGDPIYGVLKQCAYRESGTPGPTPTPAPGSSIQTFSASADYSTTQGYRNWSYLDSNGVPLNFVNTFTSAWKGSEYLYIWADQMIPGYQADAVRRFTVPQAGSVHITGNARAAGGDCGGGVSVSIKKRDTILFRRAIAFGDAVGFNFDLNETVNAGDTLDFIVNQGADGSNSCDETYFDPTITLTTH
jgi:hypothetical protein